jgi:hypothetical protein
MPIGLLFLPLVLLIFSVSLYLAFYLGKYKNSSLRKFFLAYWGVQVVLEIIYILVFVDEVQFIPPSFFLSYTYGTLFLIVYIVQCLSSNNALSVKLKYILSSIALNYLAIPLLLSFIS